MEDQIYWNKEGNKLVCFYGKLMSFKPGCTRELTFPEFVREINIIPELTPSQKRALILKAAENQGCFAWLLMFIVNGGLKVVPNVTAVIWDVIIPAQTIGIAKHKNIPKWKNLCCIFLASLINLLLTYWRIINDY